MVKRKEMSGKLAEKESQDRIEKAKDAMRKEGDEYREIRKKWNEEIARKRLKKVLS